MAALQGLAVLLLVVVLVGLLLWLPLENLPGWGWDFAVFRAGSKSILSGDNPYLTESIVVHADGAELATIPFFVYAPHFGLLISPLALLPPDLASRLWFAANLVFVISSIAILASVFRWRPGIIALSLLFLLLALHPALRTLLGVGQSAALLLFLFSLMVYSLSKGHQTAAGVCLGLALFKPHLALVLPFLAWRRQWRAVLTSLGTFAALNIAFITLADDWLRAMVSVRQVNLSYGCLPFSSLPALVDCLPAAKGIQFAGYGLMILLAIAAVVVLVPRAEATSVRFAVQISLVLVMTLLLLDNVRVADTVLLVPAIVAICATVPDLPSAWLRRSVMFLLALAIAFPLVADILGIANPIWKMPIFHSVGILAIAIALLFVAASADRQFPRLS